MASRSLKSAPTQKKEGDENPNDKRRKIGVGGRMTGPTAASRARQVLSTVTNSSRHENAPVDTASEAVSEESIEFNKEEVEALLNEKIKGKKFDVKGKLEQTTESNKKLRLCIKWFQGVEANLTSEQEKLRVSLNEAEKKCVEIDNARKGEVDELTAFIGELRAKYTALQERFAKEESDKLEAIQNHMKEKEARAAAETTNASLAQALHKAREEKKEVDQKLASANNTYKIAQEYNTSLQQYNSRLQADLATANATLQRVETEKSTIVENLGTLRGHYASLQDQLATSRASQDEAVKHKEALNSEVNCLRGELHQVRDDRDRLHSQVHHLTLEIEKYKESTGKSVAELDNLMMKSNALEETCSSQRQQLQILQHQLSSANEKLKMAGLSFSATKTEYEEQKQLILQLKTRLAEAETQINEKEILRRKLHNTILELKGNIRVFCRVRPMLPEEGCGSDASVIAYPPSSEGHEQGVDVFQNGQKHAFTFDRVFKQDASQDNVFEEISELVQSALDGYKVCIFAYGQTGSGKTYTMMGKPDSWGLIPRSLDQIFQTSQKLSSQGWKYHMQASVLEIYNETIRDLLASSRSSVDSTRSNTGVPGKELTIKLDANQDTYVSDLTIVDVCSSKEVDSLLQKAAQCRSVGKTQMNEQSSRSHFVFTLRISAINETTEKKGVLNLIDLAGSERLMKSGSTGDQLKETQNINKSLLCLSEVINGLAKKDNHVSYRNSKLTYLLKPCLSGDSKTLMFVNLSPDPTSVNESLCSLRFAARANSCQIGVPHRQTAVRSTDPRLSIG